MVWPSLRGSGHLVAAFTTLLYLFLNLAGGPAEGRANLCRLSAAFRVSRTKNGSESRAVMAGSGVSGSVGRASSV